MTKLTLKGMSRAAAEALEPHVGILYADQTARRLIVGEIQHEERTEPGPASGKQRSVVVRVSQLEVPGEQQQRGIAEVLRALYLLRTAKGTFDEVNGTISLAAEAQKVADASSMIYVEDALDARAMLREVHKRLNGIAGSTTSDTVKQRRDIRKVVGILERFLDNGASVDELVPQLHEQTELALTDDPQDTPVDVTEPRVPAPDAAEQPAAAELAGQDVGTRVPAPPFAEPAAEAAVSEALAGDATDTPTAEALGLADAEAEAEHTGTQS